MSRRKGKYEDILPLLRKMPSSALFEDPKYGEKVEAMKRLLLEGDPDNDKPPTFTEITGSALALEYTLLRREKGRIEDELSGVNLRLEAVKQLMLVQFEQEGVKSVTLADGTNVRHQPEPHAVVKNPDVFRQWCIDNGLERSLQLPWAKTNAMTKEFLLRGETPPDGVEAFQKDKVVFSDGE